MEKIRMVLSRANSPRMRAEGTIITLGIVCCAGAIVLVLAVALAAA